MSESDSDLEYINKVELYDSKMKDRVNDILGSLRVVSIILTLECEDKPIN